ncbi:acyl-CoA thioesterase [Paenibacillus protaetiae]|uniref:Acyl-CoA thioesterase n=1 Tax=Paenibacillus protaetiae TaxID=2509456 RepID=A0A4P6ESD3_9BACL|nr:acyl-CoA thioesterase [Paenibacillus protaetiae]QAY66020.1 acyl-CoA thioesterase [Paenibacillus protaetiae]
MQVAGKPAKDSRTVTTQIIFPVDANHNETMFGGKLMEIMDKTAAIAALRHARMQVVTASTDSLDFLAPIQVGEAIEAEAFVTWTHRTSMEVFVSVMAENVQTGERKRTVTGFFTFVAMQDGKPSAVPPVIPESELEKHLFQTAGARYELRQKRKQDRQIDL